MPKKHRAIHSRQIKLDLLRAIGVEDPGGVRRVVVDINVDAAVMIYIERFGDERMLDLETTLRGIRLEEVAVPSDRETVQ